MSKTSIRALSGIRSLCSRQVNSQLAPIDFEYAPVGF